MNHLTNYKHKIDSNDTSLGQLTVTQLNPKVKKKIYEKCNECNKRRKPLDESHQVCRICYMMKITFKPSGNKIIDDFIRHTQINLIKKEGKMMFVPYDQFKNIEFIAEGGFSKIYKATWVDGPIKWTKDDVISRSPNYKVVLKKLNNSKNITSKELNELKIFYNYYTKWIKLPKKNTASYQNCSKISEYFGITQDLDTQDFMFIMPYYSEGDLIRYISNDFYKIAWLIKLDNLKDIIIGLINIHSVGVIHRDFHSGNIFFKYSFHNSNYNDNVYIGDLGISKSATESTDNNEIYGIIPYMAPEIFQRQKYTKASDIYSFGMIMWEFMTGRRPFWDRNHDAELILDTCDGLRPPIVTNAPEGYIELMKECWDSNPEKRPTANDVYEGINKMFFEESNRWCSTSIWECRTPTEIIKSLDIGPVITNNPGAVYKSRPLSSMINSAMSLRSLRSQSISLLEKVKRKFEDNNDDDQYIKRKKLYENENNDYVTKEIDLDIDINDNNNEYITTEYDFDIEF